MAHARWSTSAPAPSERSPPRACEVPSPKTWGLCRTRFTSCSAKGRGGQDEHSSMNTRRVSEPVFVQVDPPRQWSGSSAHKTGITRKLFNFKTCEISEGFSRLSALTQRCQEIRLFPCYYIIFAFRPTFWLLGHLRSIFVVN